jgi:hypothetical protein
LDVTDDGTGVIARESGQSSNPCVSMDMQGLLDRPVKPGEDKKAAKLYIGFRNDILFDKSVSTKLGISRAEQSLGSRPSGVFHSGPRLLVPQ